MDRNKEEDPMEKELAEDATWYSQDYYNVRICSNRSFYFLKL